MRRPRHHVVVPDAPHHVILRGNNRRRLFSFDYDYRFFLRQLGRGMDKHPCEIHALTLMANHVHLLITPSSVERLTNFMKFVAQTYAQFRNRRRDGSGKLFEERFRAERVVGADGIQSVTVYIDANPLKAGIVSDAAEYRWSTFALHAGEPDRSQVPRSLVTLSPWYLSLGHSPPERASAYRQLFAEGVDRTKLVLKAECQKLEERSTPYTRRLERPNRTRASEREVDASYCVRALVDPRRQK